MTWNNGFCWLSFRNNGNIIFVPSLVWYFESFVSFIIQDGHCYFVILSLFFSNIFLFPLKNKPFRSFMLINSSHIPIFMRTSFTNSLSPCCPYSPCFIRNFYVYAPALYDLYTPSLRATPPPCAHTTFAVLLLSLAEVLQR